MWRSRVWCVPTWTWLAVALAVPAWGGSVRDGRDVFGPFFEAQRSERTTLRPRHGDAATSWVRHWNEVAIDASGLDHTPPPPRRSA